MSGARIDEEVITKYLTGSADESERVLVEYFIQQEGAIDIFEKVWCELHQDMNTQPQDKISNPVRMENWKETIRQKMEKNLDLQPISASLPFITKRVAIWAIFLLCGVLWGASKFINKSHQSKSETEWITYATSNGKRAIIHLSDSTTIYLGAGSTLQYPKRFAEHNRDVRLEGEAFFEVAKDPKKTFSVISGEIITQVLGTSFKIESFAESPTLVSVSTGKVHVSQILGNQEQLLAELTAGQQVIWDKQIGAVQTNVTVPTSAKDFINGKLVFEDRPLAEITEALERNYNLAIEIQRHSLAKKPIRITLEKKLTRQEMMEVIAAAGGFSYTMDKSNGNIKIF